MVRGDIELNNIEYLYNIIKDIFTEESWDIDFGSTQYDRLCENASVVFHLTDVNVTEYIHLKNIASSVIPTSNFNISIHQSEWTEPILSLSNEIINGLNEIVSTFNEEDLPVIMRSIPCGFVSLSCNVEFTGHELALLMGYYKSNLNDDFDDDVEPWQHAISKPYFGFFYEVSKYVKPEDQFIEIRPISLKPYNHEIMDPVIRDVFSALLAGRLYNAINRYTVIDKYGDGVLLYDDQLFTGDIDSTDAIAYRFSSPVFTLNNIGSDKISDMPWKYIRDIANGASVNINMISANQYINIVAKMDLYSYIYLLSIIPYQWIRHATIPDTSFMRDRENKIITGETIETVNGYLEGDHRYRFRDYLMEFYNTVFRVNVNDEISSRRESIDNISLSMLTPMEVMVDRVYIRVPLLEAAILANNMIAIAKEIGDPTVSSIIKCIVDSAKLLKQLLIPPTK